VNLLEYQAKTLFALYGISVPPWMIAASEKDVLRAAGEIGLPCVLKAQVPIGLRKQNGGIFVSRTLQELRENTSALLSVRIRGWAVEKILVQKYLPEVQPYSLGIFLDASSGLNRAFFSPAPGKEYEEILRDEPGSITHVTITRHTPDKTIEEKIQQAGYPAGDLAAVTALFFKILKLYFERDALYAEINAYIDAATHEGHAEDGKIVIDDFALFKQTAVQELAAR
jgi:succinyl-CoA synthetase beta subunit